MTESNTTVTGIAPAHQPSCAQAPEPPSIIILTRNEERNIAECLRTLSFSDDIVILDSLSTDRTLEIARSFPNVRVQQRPFDTEWKQRNYALHEIPYKHPWVYICDADERVPRELAQEIVRVINDPAREHVAYRLRFKNMFMGRWIRRASSYPVWIMRLVRPRSVSYEVRETNVHPIVDGTSGWLREHFIHYSFNSGMERWLTKHNFYSSREAMEGVKVRSAGRPSLRGAFTGDPMQRRRTLKNFSYFLPWRGVWRFLASYFVYGGFLDSGPGLYYSIMMAMYEYWLELKIKEEESDWHARGDECLKRLMGPESPPRSADQEPLIDIIIPTLNEADHVVEAVKNARTAGSVYVLDSLSTDGTQDLARQAGASVFEHEFVDYAQQKNWAIDNLPLKGKWVYILDADERITPALREELLAAARGSGNVDGYYVNRVLIFMGRVVRHGGLYPSWNLRFWKRGTARYENRSVHEHVMCTGPTAYLKGEMIHIHRETIARFIEKHIRYADMECRELIKYRFQAHGSARPGDLFRHGLRVRQWLRRSVWPVLPMRCFWRPFYMYIVRAGFLDGRAGWHSALLMGCYEFMISLLSREKWAEKRYATPPKVSS